MLRGTIRDHVTQERRPFLRFFACEEDLSHEPPDTPLPDAVARGPSRSWSWAPSPAASGESGMLTGILAAAGAVVAGLGIVVAPRPSEFRVARTPRSPRRVPWCSRR